MIRSETTSWNIPYCSACLKHIELLTTVKAARQVASEAQEAADHAEDARRRRIKSLDTEELRLEKRAAFLTTHRRSFAIAIGVLGGLFCITILFIRTILILPALPVVCALTLITYILTDHLRIRAPKVLQAFRRQRAASIESLDADVSERLDFLNLCFKKLDRLKDQQRAATSSRCISLEPAASFEGWSGSVQTFVFDNPEFVELFKESNKDKNFL